MRIEPMQRNGIEQMIPKDWRGVVSLCSSEVTRKLFGFVEFEYSTKNIFPKKENLFRSLQLVSPDSVKVVILGQDPYHGKDQADGLAFSVSSSQKIPPSLKNIYKEMMENGGGVRTTGDLSYLAMQGVLLLNTTMSVVEGKPLSHKGKGWEEVTDVIISSISKNSSGIVFMLWGSNAAAKHHLIDEERHYVLCAPHPSPLSAYRGFLGSHHFSLCNNYLKKTGRKTINW